MNIPAKVLVTDQEVNLTKLTELQRKYFLLLASHIKNKYFEAGLGRFTVSISGPSGSGKSVLSKIIEELLNYDDNFTCHTIDLDAFHYSNDELKQKKLLDVKGRYDTYNTKQLRQLLDLFKSNNTVTFPKYSRKDHEPHSNGPTINTNNTIILLPGLWIQRNDADWNKIRKYIDYTITIDGNIENFKHNTIKRHVRGGRKEKDAEKFYESSDYINTMQIKQNSCLSNLKLPYFEDILSDEDIKFF